jgi:rubrerythrin
MSAHSIWDWVADATPYEVLSFALRMEQGALRRYTRMAGQAKSRLMSAKLRYLAEEEREHARLLGEAIRGMARPAKLRRTPISRAEVAGFPEGDTPEASLRLALRAEKDSGGFYRRCAARCRKAAARKLFEGLVEQESRHARLLQDELVLLGGGFAWRSLEGTPPPEEDFWKSGD